MATIGKLEKGDLRDIWAHEEYDFSLWLAQEENLKLLGDTIKIDISLIEKESKIGGYSADIYAEEDGTDNKIIIENQLEDTNHDHLGKIITYASGKDAKYVIWIVKHARDEHRRAIEWLNEHTDTEIGFFLLEIELWKIGDSAPAPKFNIVEQPNDWAKEEKKSSSVVSESAKKCLEFWKAFNAYAEKDKAFVKSFNLRKPRPQQWYDLGVNNANLYISMNVLVRKGTLNTGLYIPHKKEIYDALLAQKSEIEKIVGCELIWRQASKASRLFVEKEIDVEDQGNWETCFRWLMDMNRLFKEVCGKVKDVK